MDTSSVEAFPSWLSLAGIRLDLAQCLVDDDDEGGRLSGCRMCIVRALLGLYGAVTYPFLLLFFFYFWSNRA